MLFKFFIVTVLIAFSHFVFAQQLFFPLNHSLNNQYDKYLNSTDFSFHTSIKPYLESDVRKFINLDSLQGYDQRHQNFISKRKHPWYWRKLWKENFLFLKTDEYNFTADPLFNLQWGNDFDNNEQTFVNTRGIIITGGIKNDFSFSTSFYENQASFAGYIDTFIKKNKVVPGQGNPQKFKNSQSTYDYRNADAYISYTPSKFFNIQFGHGKNFIGNGYRSMILSDNAYAYPFLKITTNVWRIKYLNLYTEFLDLNAKHTFTNGFYKKYGAFHYLDIAVSKKLEIGFFEAVIQANDSLGKSGIDVNYLNPVIFYRSVESGLGSPDNTLLGLNLKYKLSSSYTIYGQLIIDDFNFNKAKKGFSNKDSTGFFQNKFGYQIGFKAFDVFNVKNLFFQTEYNHARPYLFGHKSTLQNYAHYNQSLTHPLGANFKESITFINYNIKDFSFELKFVYASYGADSANTHYGQNIFKTDSVSEYGLFSFGNKLGQGISTDILTGELKISYLLNPKTNMRLELGAMIRNYKTAFQSAPTTFIYFGWSTNLNNSYYDF